MACQEVGVVMMNLKTRPCGVRIEFDLCSRCLWVDGLDGCVVAGMMLTC